MFRCMFWENPYPFIMGGRVSLEISWEDKAVLSADLVTSDRDAWATTNALRLSAAFRHYSQAALRRREWVPQAITGAHIILRKLFPAGRKICFSGICPARSIVALNRRLRLLQQICVAVSQENLGKMQSPRQ